MDLFDKYMVSLVGAGRYVGNKCLKRMEEKMLRWTARPPEHPLQSINSFLGITSHYRAFNIRMRWISGPLKFSSQDGYYTRRILTADYGSVAGKGGVAYGRRTAICLEPQRFPDSPNKPDWGEAPLRPGEKYRARLTYAFSVK